MIVVQMEGQKFRSGMKSHHYLLEVHNILGIYNWKAQEGTELEIKFYKKAAGTQIW
jgi:hypothetical protein